jgi:hypothetical protein
VRDRKNEGKEYERDRRGRSNEKADQARFLWTSTRFNPILTVWEKKYLTLTRAY